MGVKVTAYLPLAKGAVMDNSVMQDIAEKHNVSPAQVAIAWQLANDYVAIPSTTKVEHLKSNFDAQNLKLDQDDMKAIADIDKDDRLIDPDFSPDWD